MAKRILFISYPRYAETFVYCDCDGDTFHHVYSGEITLMHACICSLFKFSSIAYLDIYSGPQEGTMDVGYISDLLPVLLPRYIGR